LVELHEIEPLTSTLPVSQSKRGVYRMGKTHQKALEDGFKSKAIRLEASLKAGQGFSGTH